MKIWNDFNDGRRRPSKRARVAVFVLAAATLLGAGTLGVYRARPAERKAMTDPTAAPAPALPSRRLGTIAAVRPRTALRDEPLKDAVGDFRLLKPGDEKLPNTTIIGKSGPGRTYRWAGAYAGINLGGAAGTSALRTSVRNGDYFLPPDVSQLGGLGSRNASPTGFVGGGQVGYSCQHGSVVMGLEADLDALQLSKKQTQSGTYNSSPANSFALSQSIRTDWLVTVRPRIGLAFDRTLVFATVGAAITKFKYDEEFTDTFSPALARASISETRLGWTVGGGAEYALEEHWSLKAEYLYADFGKISTTSRLTAPPNKADVFDHSATFNVHIVRLGLNYRF